MTYVDGFVLPVAKKNLAAYRSMATSTGKTWKKHGALQYFECVADDLKPNTGGMPMLSFQKMAKLRKGETVFFSFIVYKSKAHRNSVNKKVMAEFSKDPNMKNMPMPFDIKRVAYAGFKAIVEA